MSDPYRRRRRASDGTSLATKVVTTAVVAYGAYRLVDWAYQTWWKSFNDNDNEQHQHATRQGIETTTNSASDAFFHPQPPTRQQRRAKQARLARCQMECTQAWYALGSSAMFSVLETATDITQATHRLKELRRNNNAAATTTTTTAADQGQTEQAELWNLVKVRSVTRWVATAYAQSLLMLVLTVQVNLWGAQLWHEQQQESGALSTAASSQSSMERMQSYRQEHEQVLQQTFGYFFSKGMLDLVATIERATQVILQDWNVLDKAFLHTTPGALLQALDEIRTVVEEKQQPARQRRSLWRFFVPPDTYEHGVAESEILAETWDWLESPLLQEALDATLNVTFDYGRQACLPWSLSSSGEEEAFSLAQLLPKLKKCAARFQANEQNPLLQRVHQVPTVNEIGILCFR